MISLVPKNRLSYFTRLRLQRNPSQKNRDLSSWTDNKYVPRRALFYLPASEAKKVKKLPQIEVDCLALDCEDGVAFNQKQAAREAVLTVLNKPSKLACHELGVRINSVSSNLLEEDLKCIGEAATLPPCLMLPKVDSIDDLKAFSSAFRHNCATHLKDHQHSTRLLIWIESARALLDMPKIVEAAINLKHHTGLQIDGCVFGSDDFCADVQITRTTDATELMYARQKFVSVCKAFKLQAIDIVYIDYQDLIGLKKQSEEGFKFGFNGKQIIHPGQIQIVQTAFVPTPEKIAWAQKLLGKFGEYEEKGKGAFTFNEQMIDMPLVLQARNILAVAIAAQQVKKQT